MKRPPKELERKWYRKLAETGFEDIEDTSLPYRPLKEWHSGHFHKQDVQHRRKGALMYFAQAEHLLNHPDFDGICHDMVVHKNARFTPDGAKEVWRLHCEGLSVREIAADVGYTRMRVQNIVEGLRKWMRLLS